MAAVTGSIEGRRYVTMRFKRIKTWAHAYHVRRHNTREMECKHLEAGAPEPNMLVGGRDVSGAIRAVLSEHRIRPRDGEVLALEFVVSTSREVFDEVEGEDRRRRIANLVVCTMRAFCDRFPIPGQIVSMALHEDERTPHLHVVVVPLTRESDRRRRDQAPVVRLSAKRVVGGRGDMSREQTRFASFFAEMGLERGVERSGARHVSNREHEAMLERARQESVAEREAWGRERSALDIERMAFEEEMRTRRADLEQREAALVAREIQAQSELEAAQEIRVRAEEAQMAASGARRDAVEAKREAARAAAIVRAEQADARKLKEQAGSVHEEALCLRDEGIRFRDQAITMLTEIRKVYEKAKDLQRAIIAVPPIQRPAAAGAAMAAARDMSRAGARIEIPDFGLDAATIAAFQSMKQAALGR